MKTANGIGLLLVGLVIGVSVGYFAVQSTGSNPSPNSNPQTVTVSGTFAVSNAAAAYCPCTLGTIQFISQTGQQLNVTPSSSGAYSVNLLNHEDYQINANAYDSGGSPLNCGDNYLNLNVTTSSLADDISC